jgi:hypothetical protein
MPPARWYGRVSKIVPELIAMASKVALTSDQRPPLAAYNALHIKSHSGPHISSGLSANGKAIRSLLQNPHNAH